MTFTHLDLFSGIGGFSLAANWAGFETIAFCENDPDASIVLAHHYPKTPNLGDVRSVKVDTIASLLYDHWMNSKYDEAVRLYNSGLSIEDCAEFFDISRSAMWKILRRRGVVFRSRIKVGKENHFYRGGSMGSGRVNDLTERAIEKGVLIPQPCEVCGLPATLKDGRRTVQAHHDDYNKPLEVRWFCQPHHHEWHKHNKPKARTVDFPTMSKADICSLGGRISGERRSEQLKREMSKLSQLAKQRKLNDKSRKRGTHGTPAGTIDVLTAGVP